MEATESKPQTAICQERKTCRACESKTLVSVLDLGLQALPRFPEAGDEKIPEAPLHLVQCGMCGLLQLLHSVDPDLVFRQYYYRSSVNQTMRDALQDLVLSACELVRKGTWLDIGANDGTLLSKVPVTFRKVACEPAATFTAQLHEHAGVVIPEYFSRKHLTRNGEFQADVITSAAMFYDLDDPNAFVEDISRTLTDQGVWVNQLNDSPTMLRRNAFDSVVHEHLCYYDLPSLKDMYRRHGLSITQVTYNEVNGGSVRVFASKLGRRPSVTPEGHRRVSIRDVQAFARRVARWREQMRQILDSDLMRYRPLWGYGASTKLGTLLGYLGRNDMFIGIADRNPAKWGKRFGNTGIPIVSEADFRAAKPGYVLVGPWAFKQEFLERERAIMEEGATLVFPLPNIEFCV